MDDQTGQHLGTDWVRLKLKRGDDTEIAAAAPDTPEELRIIGFARRHRAPICKHDACRQQIVDRHPVLSTEPSEPTAQGQAGDSSR